MTHCSASRRRPSLRTGSAITDRSKRRVTERSLRTLAASLLLGGCAPKAAVIPDVTAEPAAVDATAADGGGGGPSLSHGEASSAAPEVEAAGPMPTTAASEAPAVFEAPVPSPIGPAYYARMREGWVEVLVHAKDSEQVVAMINALDGRSEIWAGDRRVAPELAALPRLRLIGSRGVSEPLAWAQADGEIGMTEAWWRLRYRPRGNKGPFLAVQDAAPAGTKLRKPSPPRTVKKSHPFVAPLLGALAEDKDAKLVPLTSYGVTYTVQAIDGAFPDAAAVAIVTAVDPGETREPGYDVAGTSTYSVLLALDGEGRVVRPAAPSFTYYFHEAYAVGDVDGNGFDDLLLEGTAFEAGSVDLVLFGVDGPTWVNLFRD